MRKRLNLPLMYQEKHLHHLLSRFKVEEGEVLDLRDYATSWEGTEQMLHLGSGGLFLIKRLEYSLADSPIPG